MPTLRRTPDFIWIELGPLWSRRWRWGLRYGRLVERMAKRGPLYLEWGSVDVVWTSRGWLH